MLRALVVLGLVGLGQAYVNAQLRARRQKVSNAVNERSLQNWEDEGGAVPGGAQQGPQLARVSGGAPQAQASDTLGAYPSAAQTG